VEVALGSGVDAPAVSTSGVPVATNNVGVNGMKRDCVGVAGMADDPHPVSRANAIDRIKRVLVFILYTSIDNYIPWHIIVENQYHPAQREKAETRTSRR
jgi:hypothetical protein